MSQISDNIRCMASLAVFRELYNSNKSDIFSVIAAFAETIIIREKKYHFELQEFCLMLNNEYGFTLVTSIVKTALKKISFLTSIKTQYTVDTAKLQKDNKFEHDFRTCQETNTKILDDFISFVAKIIKRPMSDDETQSLKEDFCAYTLDHKVCNPENLGYISAYILNQRDSQEFQSQLTRIREGMIIYNGLSYTLSPNEVEKYDADLNIFLETEVLFNMAGYNGMLCQHLFDEFYEQVFEINKSALLRNGKKVIHLKFFEESFNEINKFFKQAEDIISGNSRLVDPRNAMVCLLNGCSKKYEIKEKQTAFEKMLREKDIILEQTKQEKLLHENIISLQLLMGMKPEYVEELRSFINERTSEESVISKSNNHFDGLIKKYNENQDKLKAKLAETTSKYDSKLKVLEASYDEKIASQEKIDAANEEVYVAKIEQITSKNKEKSEKLNAKKLAKEQKLALISKQKAEKEKADEIAAKNLEERVKRIIEQKGNK